MKSLSLLVVAMFCVTVMSISGCGGGNDGAGGLVGSFTVTGSQSSSESSSEVSFTIKYTNPYRTDLTGVPLNYVITVNGKLVADVATNFATGGTLIVSYTVPKASVDQVVRCDAQTGNLKASDAEVVTAYGALAISPLSETFAEEIGAQLTYKVSGGLPPYIFSVSQAPADIVTYISSGDSITLTRSVSTAGSVIITATDFDGNSVSAEALLQEFVPTP